jgi:hypothetical protein
MTRTQSQYSPTDAPPGASGWARDQIPASPSGPALEPLVVPLQGKYALHVNRFNECDWCSVFNTIRFFRLHKTGAAFYFQLCAANPASVVGVAHFTEVEPGYYRSPLRGTFGGFEFRQNLRVESVEAFVAGAERRLLEAGARTIEILAAPANLTPSASAVMYNILPRRGYSVTHADLDCFLTVDAVPLVEKLNHSRRQRINKCRREGMTASEVNSAMRRQVYEVILANRQRRGYPITMTYEAIQEMVAVFPRRLVFFGAFAGQEMIASSICVWVSPAVLYVLYWGDLDGWGNFSPVSLLIETIYDYARQNGCRVLDLGTASKDGRPNYGLLSFKHDLGCEESLKLTFVKRVA